MKDLNYYKNNCEENYITTPISVLRYITELEKDNEAKQLILSGVSQQRELLSQYTEFLNWKLPVEREIKLTEIKEFFDWLNCG